MSYSEYYFCSRRETENRYQEYGGKIQHGTENTYQEYGDPKMAGTGSIIASGQSPAPSQVDPKIPDNNYMRFQKLMKFCKANNLPMEYRKKILDGKMTTDEYLATVAPQNFQTEEAEQAPEAPETPVEEPVAEQPVETTAEPVEKPKKRSKKKSEEV